MLVLSRRKEESIIAGENENIEIKIVDIRANKVRLGITAPNAIAIRRKEILDAIQYKRAKKPKS